VAVLEFSTKTAAHLDMQIRGDCHVPEIEQPMEVRLKQKAVADLVRATLAVRNNMRGLQHGQRVFVRDGARTLVRVSDSDSEGALPKPRAHQHGVPVASAFLADDQNVTRQYHADGRALVAFSPDARALSDRQVVSRVAQVSDRPIGRLRDPLLWCEEDGLNEDDTADLRETASATQSIALPQGIEAPLEIFEGGCAITLAEAFPR
jgi:hypothetical protein